MLKVCSLHVFPKEVPMITTKITEKPISGRSGDFWGYHLYLKSLVGAEGPNIFEFSTSMLLEKALKALPSHLLCFFIFFLFWAPEFEC